MATFIHVFLKPCRKVDNAQSGVRKIHGFLQPWVQVYFVLKDIGSEKLCVQKYLLSQKIGSKQTLGSWNFVSKKEIGPTNFWSQKNVGQKNIMPNIF